MTQTLTNINPYHWSIHTTHSQHIEQHTSWQYQIVVGMLEIDHFPVADIPTRGSHLDTLEPDVLADKRYVNLLQHLNTFFVQYNSLLSSASTVE